MSSSIIFFLSSPEISSLYHGRAEKLLLGLPNVADIWYAESEDAFQEITSKSSSHWDVIVTDMPMIAAKQELFDGLVAGPSNPILGIQYSEEHQPESLYPNALLFKTPQDVDEWLATMHTLLQRADSANTP